MKLAKELSPELSHEGEGFFFGIEPLLIHFVHVLDFRVPLAPSFGPVNTPIRAVGLVAKVLRASSFAQIPPDVIALAPVNVINVISRPYACHVEPCKAMSPDSTTWKGDKSVAVAWKVSSITNLMSISDPNKSSEVPRAGVVAHEPQHLVMGNIKIFSFHSTCPSNDRYSIHCGGAPCKL